MMINTLKLVLFKGFKATSVDFNPGLNLLVGANNSGKSSLLQGIYVAFYFLGVTDGISEYDKKRESGSRLKGITVRSVPLPLHDESYLSEGLKKRTRGDDVTSISLMLDDSVSFRETITFPGGNLLARSSDLKGASGSTSYQKKIKRFLKKSSSLPLFIPAFGGVTSKEEVRRSEVVKHYIGLGKSSEVLRNQLNGMKTSHLEKLNRYLKNGFGVEIVASNTKEIYLSALYKDSKYDNQDISSAGSGFQQVLQILVYIVTSEADVILVDEPDAHLHHQLQNTLYDILQDLASDGKQIIIATHSQVFIRRAIEHSDRLILVNKSLEEQKPLSDYKEGAKILYEAGIVDENDVTVGASVSLIDLEDSPEKEGFKVMREFLSKLGFREPRYRLTSAGTHIFGYVSGKERLDNLKLKALIFRDSDSVPDEQLQKMEKEKTKSGTALIYTRVHEVENYLLNAPVISRVLKGRGVKGAGVPRIKKLIEDVARKNQNPLIDKLEAPLNDQFTKHWRTMGLDDYPGALQVAGERRREIRDNHFSYPFSLLPGKQLFALVKEEIRKKYGTLLTSTEIVQAFTKAEIPQEIKDALKFFDSSSVGGD